MLLTFLGKLSAPRSRASRADGVRTSGSTIPLAVYGLPLGLLAAGELFERTGIAPTLPLYRPAGSLALLLLGVAWQRQRRT